MYRCERVLPEVPFTCFAPLWRLGGLLAKPNYQFEKRQRDLAKKSKQEEKRRQKLTDKAAERVNEDVAMNSSDSLSPGPAVNESPKT